MNCLALGKNSLIDMEEPFKPVFALQIANLTSVLMTIVILEGRDFKKLSKKRKDDAR